MSPKAERPARAEHDQDFESLLEYLKRNRGFDFTGYKRSSLKRRVLKQMQAVKIESFADYTDYLEVHPGEFAALFNTILINVTAFFRDMAAWEELGARIVPRILANKASHEPIRVWCAGCATGEEAYTLAMVFAEAVGIDTFRARVKIYATDIDDEALAKARHAAYTQKELQGIPTALLKKYYEPQNHRFAFNKELRRAIIFGRHDLIQDAPISRIDLLSCRNTLMYFNSETQARVLERLHFALADRGFLFLGKVETLLSYGDMFAPVDAKQRIFIKVPKGTQRDRLMIPARAQAEDVDPRHINTHRVHESAFEAAHLAQIVVNKTGFLVLANERARALFGLSPSDLGRPLQDLQVSYKPIELRSCIERATRDKQPVVVPEVEWRAPPPGSEIVFLQIVVKPIPNGNGNGNGNAAVLVMFNDITDAKRLESDLHHTNVQLESAYEELQATNEELETTNEELQSTIEELETTNEELQSTNEELETMNEELQSTNEELQALNDEHQQRSEELNRVNDFLESILASMKGAVVVLDRDLVVQVWNERSEDLWGLRQDETVGKHFLNLDFGLTVGTLRPCIKAALAGESDGEPLTLDATNRRGKRIGCRINFFPLVGQDKATRGVILLMEERDGTLPESRA